MSCNKFYFITSFTVDGTNVVLGTNHPITDADIPSLVTMRLSKCITPLVGYETYPLVISINGTDEQIVLNKYGESMVYGDLPLTYTGCLDTRFTIRGALGANTFNNQNHVIMNNVPIYNKG